MPTLTNTSVTNPILIPLGIIEPPFTDTLTENGNAIDPSELSEVKFFMRPLLSRSPIIDGESGQIINPISQQGNNIKYEWTESDVATEGEYMAWWGFRINNGEEQQTPEFMIIISDHGPGTGVETGAIVDGVSDHMPITAEALKRSPSFGERRMQKIATLIQLRILKSSVPPDQEIIAYELPLLDYFAKRVALELCTPGIDYWARQHKTSTTQGPTEITSFPDMIQALEKLRDRLVIELEENWRELSFFVPELKQRKAVAMPGSSLEFYETPESNGRLIRREEPLGFVTKNPNTYQKLITGVWGNGIDQYGLGFWPFP
jgi:hypothetical protein